MIYLTFFLLSLYLLQISNVYSIREVSSAELELIQSDTITIINFSSDRNIDLDNKLKILESVELNINKKYSELQFVKLDGNIAANNELIKDTSLETGNIYIFSTVNESIERYINEITEENIILFIESLYINIDQTEDIIKKYENDYNLLDLINSKPVFLKFYLESDEHSQSYQSAFQRIAKYFNNQAIFVEADCEIFSNFCNRQNLNGYPDVVLFTKDNVYRFNQDRSIVAFKIMLDNLDSGKLPNTSKFSPVNPKEDLEELQKKLEKDKELSSLIEEVSADEVQKNTDDKLVIFYYGHDEENIKTTFPIIESVAATLKQENKDINLRFVKCDGDLPENKSFFDAGKFKGIKIFISTSDTSIQPYNHKIEAFELLKVLRSYFIPIENIDIVKTYVEDKSFLERISHKRPLLVKFFKDSCPHCRSFKMPFIRYAHHFKKSVDFMDVDCSLNKVFCGNFTLGGFPSVILFTAGNKYQFKESSRSIISFEIFFSKHLTADLLNIPPLQVKLSNTEATKILEEKQTEDKKPSIYNNVDLSSRKLVEEISADDLKANSDDKLVIFYPNSSSEEFLKVLRVVEQVSKTVRLEKPEFRFFKCGADIEDNKHFFNTAKFKKEEINIFLNLQKGGICIFFNNSFVLLSVPYKQEIDALSILKVVRGYNLPPRPDLVKQFPGDRNLADRLVSNARPILAKLYVDSCVHCNNFKIPFERYAGYFEDRVDFMDINCKSSVAKNFCKIHNKKGSYPSIRLLNSGKVANYDGDRTLLGIEKFINEHVSSPETLSTPVTKSHEDL